MSVSVSTLGVRGASGPEIVCAAPGSPIVVKMGAVSFRGRLRDGSFIREADRSSAIDWGIDCFELTPEVRSYLLESNHFDWFSDGVGVELTAGTFEGKQYWVPAVVRASAVELAEESPWPCKPLDTGWDAQLAQQVSGPWNILRLGLWDTGKSWLRDATIENEAVVAVAFNNEHSMLDVFTAAIAPLAHHYGYDGQMWAVSSLDSSWIGTLDEEWMTELWGWNYTEEDMHRSMGASFISQVVPGTHLRGTYDMRDEMLIAGRVLTTGAPEGISGDPYLLTSWNM